MGRLVRMHADEMEDIEAAGAGDIVALFGIDCASGDTFTDGSARRRDDLDARARAGDLALDQAQGQQGRRTTWRKALGRFAREDPTFRAGVDEETGETIISGMGELHLDVYVERMRREYSVEVETGAPQVAYRETISQRAEFNYTHKKQTGGSGQYGRVAGYIEPLTGRGSFEFVNEVARRRDPRRVHPRRWRRASGRCSTKGRLIGFPVIGLRVVPQRRRAHAVDSSDIAFQAAARGAFRDVYPRRQAASSSSR